MDWKTLSPTLTRLSPLRKRQLLKLVGKGQEPEEVGPGGCLFFWLAQHLAARQPVGQEAVDCLLAEFCGVITRFGDELEGVIASGAAELPVLQLAIFDGRYA